jgi:hypothetical protein
MVERRGGIGFALNEGKKLLLSSGRAVMVGTQYLDGDQAVRPHLAGKINRPHAAHGETALDYAATEVSPKERVCIPGIRPFLDHVDPLPSCLLRWGAAWPTEGKTALGVSAQDLAQ